MTDAQESLWNEETSGWWAPDAENVLFTTVSSTLHQVFIILGIPGICGKWMNEWNQGGAILLECGREVLCCNLWSVCMIKEKSSVQ